MYRIAQKLYELQLNSKSAYTTPNMAALFVRHFPRRLHGVFAPSALPAKIHHATLEDARQRGFRITTRLKLRKNTEPDKD